jgi:hypothetical protein
MADQISTTQRTVTTNEPVAPVTEETTTTTTTQTAAPVPAAAPGSVNVNAPVAPDGGSVTVNTPVAPGVTTTTTTPQINVNDG